VETPWLVAIWHPYYSSVLDAGGVQVGKLCTDSRWPREKHLCSIAQSTGENTNRDGQGEKKGEYNADGQSELS
jgi:hypothetical protein